MQVKSALLIHFIYNKPPNTNNTQPHSGFYMQSSTPMPQPWLAFSRPNVRDLAYALCCPPVLLHMPKNIQPQAQQKSPTLPNNLVLPNTAFWHTHFVNYLPKLQALEANPQPLNQFLGQQLTSFRLGFRFEALLLFWLQDTAYHHYQLIAHNIQIFANTGNNATTTGELDFLVHNTATNDIEHWEVAIKFFLGEAPFTPAHWKGLKGADNLAKKTQHMLTKPFSHQHVMVDGVTYKVDKRVAIIKGRFFEPVHEQAALAQANLAWLNPALPRGKWYNHIPTLHDQETQQWRAARRVEWFTKRDCYDAFDLGTHPKQKANGIYAFSGRRKPLTWQTGLYFQQHLPHANPAHPSHDAVMLRLD